MVSVKIPPALCNSVTGKWLDDNCESSFYLSYGQVDFDDEQDAALFILRWT